MIPHARGDETATLASSGTPVRASIAVGTEQTARSAVVPSMTTTLGLPRTTEAGNSVRPARATPAATPRIRAGFIAALLLTLYYCMAVSASLTKSPTFDEGVHITAGYNAWINHDQRFDPGNGDFVKRWATLPLLFSRPVFPPLEGEDWRTGHFFNVSRDFLFHEGNNPDAILLQTRAMVALLGVALGALVFACSRQLFGDTGGLISTMLYAFCPHMLAHGAVVSTDLALTFALLASTWSIWRLLHCVTWKTVSASLLAFALLVTAKMSAVLIIPIALVLVVVRLAMAARVRSVGADRSGQAGEPATTRVFVALVLAHALVAWAAIWAVFEFKYTARADPAEVNLTLLRSPGAEVSGAIGELAQFCHRHRLLPEGYLKGMEELVGISQRRPAFMNGEWYTGGRVGFFPYAFWVKSSPALLALVLLGFVTVRRGWWYQALPLGVLFAVYAAVAVIQGLNIGHRHILPVYPVLFVLAGAAALLLPSRRRVAEILVALLLGGYALDSWWVRPHYLAYFGPQAGGPAQGYHHLVDSSLDWGQDLPGLKRWLETNNPAERETVYLSYFGTGEPEHYEIASWRLPGFPEWRDLQVFAYRPGLYAISATMAQPLYATTFGAWNAQYESDYQETVRRLGLTPTSARDNAALAIVLRTHPEAEWQELYSRYEKLRFGRLCAWLRAPGRQPDAEIGYSILVWQLDERALEDALWGPPRELRNGPDLKP
jgi:hypothetical protein